MKKNIIEFTRVSDTPDADFSHLRGEAVLQKLVRRYPADADRLARAHELLRDEPNYAPAMHRVANSLHEGCIRAFISYRVGVDADAARTVTEVFRALSANKVGVTFADEFTSRISGQDYKSEIEVATKSAHWFVFLTSDAREPSAWCMYETGMFRASATSRRMERLICLHHPGATPHSAIDGFQAVPGDTLHLQRFLDGLFRQPDPLPGWGALNPSLPDAAIVEAAHRIAAALRPPRKPVDFNPRVTITVKLPEQLTAPADLESCAIETERATANLFGKVEAPLTWGALVTNLARTPGAGAWLDELVAVLRKAGAGDVFRPIAGSFECMQGGRVLRPVLHAMEHDGTGSEFRFHLYFLDELSSAPRLHVAPTTRVLLRTVRMHNRVRWEVLERFAGVEWTPSAMASLAKVFSRIEREAMAQDPNDDALLCANYDDDAQDDVAELLEGWHALRDPVRGTLVGALRQADGAGVARGMAECRDLNRRFFELSFPVLAKMVG